MVDKNKCLGCGTCVELCPVGAIKFNAEGIAEIDPKKCIRCGTCEISCPVSAIKINR